MFVDPGAADSKIGAAILDQLETARQRGWG